MTQPMINQRGKKVMQRVCSALKHNMIITCRILFTFNLWSLEEKGLPIDTSAWSNHSYLIKVHDESAWKQIFLLAKTNAQTDKFIEEE